ncbi:hypothetical protein CGGC5_v009536 [Colletotrichum fructicola Nara gc5]|uniref:Uncharacterized protein n=1 Tax=Colletotrichum fructicola (strain Nara gc5) TaxID=1213859 RepID=A0A7J6IXI6_COLFN|nr:hypothetical protein CFRS1_v008304 [Colletotrichum fructicola]KAF4481806.1 hypothetical protein CGGC5_v009536 [Colletotrichum fructicola Nara gc5]
MWLYFVRKAQSTGSLERSSLRDGRIRHQKKGRTQSPAVFQNSRLGPIAEHPVAWPFLPSGSAVSRNQLWYL